MLTSNRSSQETVEIIEQKVAKAEASALKSFQERNSDVDVLKTSLRNASNDLETYKKDLQAKILLLIFRNLKLKSALLNLKIQN